MTHSHGVSLSGTVPSVLAEASCVFLHLKFLFFCYWGLNSGPSICEHADPVPLILSPYKSKYCIKF